MSVINVLLKLKDSLGNVINPRKEDGHGSSSGNPTHVQVGNFPATQPISAVSLPLPAGAATQATLASVLGQLDITLSALRDALRGGSGKTLTDLWNSLQTQREIATTLWTDNSGAVYVRRDIIDESTGTATIQFTDEAGNVVTPGAGLRPLASTDKETTEALFTVVTAGTGYDVDDIIARVLIIDTSTSPPGTASTWMNVTDGTIIAAPDPAHIDQYVGLTNAELRASPVPITQSYLTERFYRLLNQNVPNTHEMRTSIGETTYTVGAVTITGVDATSKYFAAAVTGSLVTDPVWDVLRIQDTDSGNPGRWRTATGVRFDLAIQGNASVWP